jgi:hypothetical protein
MTDTNTTFSIFIPSIYTNIDETMIKDTFHRNKIGRVNSVQLVQHESSKHNRAYVHFDELYSTSCAKTMLHELKNDKSSKLYYARSPHIYWVILESRRKTIKTNDTIQETTINPVEIIPEYETETETELELEKSNDNYDEYNQCEIDEYNQCEIDEYNQCEIDEYLENQHEIERYIENLCEIQTKDPIEHVVPDEHEEGESFIPIPDMSFVSSDYATILENEIVKLRSANSILNYNAHIMLVDYNCIVSQNLSLTDKIQKFII